MARCSENFTFTHARARAHTHNSIPVTFHLSRDSSLRSGFDTWPIHLQFVVGKVAVRQTWLTVLRFYPVAVTPPMFRTHSFV